MLIRQATLQDLDKLLVLFSHYRAFYQQQSDVGREKEFLKVSLSQRESIIFIAVDDKNNHEIMGFARLNLGYCSLAMNKYWILYDLYTGENYRKQGVASALLNKVKAFAIEDGASRIELQTAHTNTKAQQLYEENDYKQDKAFRTYTLELPRKINSYNAKQPQLDTNSTNPSSTMKLSY